MVGRHTGEEQQRTVQEVASQRPKASYLRAVLQHLHSRSDLDQHPSQQVSSHPGPASRELEGDMNDAAHAAMGTQHMWSSPKPFPLPSPSPLLFPPPL
ncbi:rCG36812, partial [Rattus norvegicus]